jgi:hypothetical protein
MDVTQKQPPKFIVPPLDSIVLTRETGEPPRMVTIVVRASKDKARDILRIRRIHGMLLSYPGDDKFAIYLIENGKGIRLEFPSDTTHFSDELRLRLESVVGSENIKVERITLQ